MKSVLNELEENVTTLADAERDHAEAQVWAREEMATAQAAFDEVKAKVTARVTASGKAFSDAKQSVSAARDRLNSLVTAAIRD